MAQNITFAMNDEVLTVGQHTFYEIMGTVPDATSEVAMFGAFLKMLAVICGGDVYFSEGQSGLGLSVEEIH